MILYRYKLITLQFYVNVYLLVLGTLFQEHYVCSFYTRSLFGKIHTSHVSLKLD